MSLGAPLGLLAGLLAVPLVVWYVLRSRRPKQVVASTFLWGRTERSVAAAVPWQRFRPDVTFWLVLLALLLGALALARPFVRVPAELGDHTVLVLDASGSMLADEDGPTRLELARREARDLVERLNPGQEMSVVEAGGRARVLLSASTDPAAIRRALDAVRPTHGSADLVDAFTLASALERPGQSTIVHLMTDGRVADGDADAAPEGLRVTAVGTQRPNLAVTRLQAVPVGAGQNQVFVQVRNLGTLPTTARLTLGVDGTDTVERAVDLGPRDTSDLVLQVAGGDGAVLEARVQPSGEDLLGDENLDALSIDDRAFAVLAAPRELAVTIAGPGNVFLEAAFGAVAGVTVTSTETVPTDLDGVDLLVVDRLDAPASPRIPTLLVAPTSLPAGVTDAGEVERPSVTFQAPGHELLADVDLSEVAIAVGRSIEAPALTTIAGGPQAALVAAGRLDAVPVMVVGFDLLESNLPLLPAWPILVANATSWLAGAPAPLPSVAGDTVTLAVPTGADAVEVAPPGGEVRRLTPTSPRVEVDLVGLWRLSVVGGDGGEDADTGVGAVDTGAQGLAPAIAVNPEPAESDLARPQPDPVERRDDQADDAAVASEGRRELGRQVLAAVLGLAALEWLWAFGIRPWHRRRRAERAESDRDGAPTSPARDRRPRLPRRRTSDHRERQPVAAP